MGAPKQTLPAPERKSGRRRFTTRFGPVAVFLALFIGLVSFLIFSNDTPIAPTDTVILTLFVANILSILLVFLFVLTEAYALFSARRAGVAGAELHIRIVGLFSIVAAAPALLMAWVGSVTLERSLNPTFMQDSRGFVRNTIAAANLFREGQCSLLLREASLTASDLDRGKLMFEVDRPLFRDFFTSRARFLGFTAAALIKSDGTVIERVETGALTGTAVVHPEPRDFDVASKNEPECLTLDRDRTFVALRTLHAFQDTFLYVARPVDPFTVEFPAQAAKLVALYDAFDDHRRGIRIALATMFVLIALIMLLSATWLGLSFANSLIALKADTGERVWHFQQVKHDLWDRDFPAPPNLVTVMRNGKLIDAVAQCTKSAYVFVFERETGKPLFPIEYREVPRSEVDGEATAATQPFPVKPPPFSRQILTEDMLTHRTPEAHEAALKVFRKVHSAGQFVPPSLEGTVVFPGFDGGAEWGGQAFDPATGLLYVNANEMAWILRLVDRPKIKAHTSGRQIYLAKCASCHHTDLRGSPPDFPSLVNVGSRLSEPEIRTVIVEGRGRMPEFDQLSRDEMGGLVAFLLTGEDKPVEAPAAESPWPFGLKYSIDGYNRFLDPDGVPAIEPPWGTLNAISLDTGEIVWKIPFGEIPELAAKGLRNTGSENYGGPVVTAGGLLFIGATDFDRKFHAYDKTTGKLLWETTLPAGGNATPATYEAAGRQFVVIAAGGGKSGQRSGGSYVAFALPERRDSQR